ncbi:MAG: phospholipid carrier-dependent glycosyltransferase [Actinomycetota bacterium]|nr:phospholipid carrier-dependent glycosyltransferase [Actinomycetota bacterium]
MTTTEAREPYFPQRGSGRYHTGIARAPWKGIDWIAMTSITAIGAALRLWRVSIPPAQIFDETYYAKDACWYVKTSARLCGTSSEQTTVHPPLGKWLIAVGIRFFGYNSFGWRISCVVAGTITIALLYLLARKVLNSTFGATFCAGLFAIDFLHFVQSRTSMLDVFVPLFGIAGVLFLVYDRDRLVTRLAASSQTFPGEPQPEPGGGTGSRSSLLDRRWRMAAGVCGGAATACKWSGALVLVALVMLSIAWEVSERRAEGLSHPVLKMLDEEGGSIMLWLVVLPVIVYGLTYMGRLDGWLLAWPWTQGSWLRALWERQLYMESFHRHLTAQHSYESPAWSWLLLKRPVSYYFTTTQGGKYDEIFASGNPFVWWATIPSLIYIAVVWVRSRDFTRPEGLILTGFLVTYAPWLLPQFGRPAIFVFYLLPTLPFMYLALGYVALRMGRSWEARAAQALFAAGAIVLFAFYYPLLAAVAIPQSDWNARISIFTRCQKPVVGTTTNAITTTIGGTRTTTSSTSSGSSDLPPTGWCWI